MTAHSDGIHSIMELQLFLLNGLQRASRYSVATRGRRSLSAASRVMEPANTSHILHLRVRRATHYSKRLQETGLVAVPSNTRLYVLALRVCRCVTCTRTEHT